MMAEQKYKVKNLHSSMERLKAICLVRETAAFYHLHSSMERLKVTTTFTSSQSCLQFTFQYGEIKSGINSILYICCLNLHSSMERLKVLSAGDAEIYRSQFTFQYGEIKRVDCRKNGLL